MAMAAPVVIANRAAQMALAGPTPSIRDRKELGRMGQEKVDASRESLLAAVTGIWKANVRLLQSPAASARSGVAPGWESLTETVLVSWLEVLEQTMAPFHRRVMSNKQRLQKS
jgi:hypothetical protein